MAGEQHNGKPVVNMDARRLGQLVGDVMARQIAELRRQRAADDAVVLDMLVALADRVAKLEALLSKSERSTS